MGDSLDGACNLKQLANQFIRLPGPILAIADKNQLFLRTAYGGIDDLCAVALWNQCSCKPFTVGIYNAEQDCIPFASLCAMHRQYGFWRKSDLFNCLSQNLSLVSIWSNDPDIFVCVRFQISLNSNLLTMVCPIFLTVLL